MVKIYEENNFSAINNLLNATSYDNMHKDFIKELKSMFSWEKEIDIDGIKQYLEKIISYGADYVEPWFRTNKGVEDYYNKYYKDIYSYIDRSLGMEAFDYYLDHKNYAAEYLMNTNYAKSAIVKTVYEAMAGDLLRRLEEEF